uniref:Uncharacterized protein n=1 Tax=Takifugu rubripes TaxID=31033 RepID=A0A3B5KG92_TAKRU
MEATEYEFRIFAENEAGLSRPRRTPMGIKTKLSGEFRGLPTLEIQDSTTKLGESGTLTCGIIGRPLPEIKWYRYGRELIQSRKYKMSSDGRNHSLSILTDEQEDEGLYTCRAINEAGEVETSGKLRLQAAPQFHPGFPLKEKYYAGAGTSLRLHVVYIGRPIPQIMWFYGKKPLNPSENVIIENTESGYYQLVITNADENDATVYQVRATNSSGSVSMTANLEVEVPAKIHLPKELQGMGAVHCARGDRVTIKIPISGKPEPAVTWQKGQEILSNSPYHQVITTRSFTSLLVLREIEALNVARHRNIIYLHEYFESMEEFILIFEFISGVDIFERLGTSNFDLTEQEIVRYLRQVCSALKFLHSQNVVHLD